MTSRQGVEPLGGVAVKEVLDLWPDAVLALRPDRTIVLASSDVERLFGYSSDEVVGESIELLVPEGLPAGNTGAELDRQGVRRDGTEFPAEISLSTVETEDGTVAIVAVRDVTGRKQVDERFQTLLELAPDAIVGVSEDGRIVLVNREAEKLFGYAREELKGEPVETLIPGRFQAAHHAHRARYFENPQPGPMGTGLDLHGVRRDGSEFPAEISLSVIPSPEGVLVTATIRDIDARVKRERERETLGVQLEEQERESRDARLDRVRRMESLGQLAGGIAHDFNNLLAVVLNYADFLLAELDEESPAAKDAQAIRAAAERGVVLIRQLLMFSRRDVLQPEPLDLNKVVSGLEDLLGRTIGENIALELRLTPDPWTVVADRGQIEQVLINLAVNARDAMPDGGTLRVETANVSHAAGEADDDGARSYARLSVSDTGVGMEPDVVKRAFEPFFTTKPTGRGTGLGLATVYAIVRELGGRTSLYSEPGEGTTVTVRLPGESFEPATKRVAAREPIRGDGETILVVEDADDVREMTRRILARHGYEVREAASGEEALEVIASGSAPIDLLLTDVIMPGTAGTELTERVRELGLEPKILYMSGFAGEILERRHVAHGEAAFIEKPFGPADLLAKVHGLLHPEG
jgi:PAS domain S-box-containing protein